MYTMNRFWGIAIFISFMTLSVAGFLAFMHDEHSHILACMAGFNEGALCPVNPFDWISFHVGFLKSFSLAVFAALALGLPIIFSKFIGLENAPLASFFAYSKHNQPLVPISRFKTREWLSLHIASPSF